jgi:hypothetical protein
VPLFRRVRTWGGSSLDTKWPCEGVPPFSRLMTWDHNGIVSWRGSYTRHWRAQVDLAKAGTADQRSAFYANLYLGLYAEARGEGDLARNYISAAVNSSYGQSGDYMWHLSRVHKQRRGW